LIFLLVLWCAVACLGCGPKRRGVHYVPPPDVTVVEGPFKISFFKPDMTPDRNCSPERRDLLVKACMAKKQAYERAFVWTIPDSWVEVFTEGNWAASGGFPNGGGCYIAPSRIGVRAGANDDVPDFCHELHHQQLWYRTGVTDSGHHHPTWKIAEALDLQVCEALRKERSQKHGRNP